MSDDNKTKQASIYTEIFSTDNIDYDDFMLPPNDFLREKYFASLRPGQGEHVLETGIGTSSFLARAVKRHSITAYGLDYVDTYSCRPVLIHTEPSRPFPARGKVASSSETDGGVWHR